MYTEKGLQKFNGDENFDIEEFNNKNMDRVDELLINDDVVDTENALPVAGSLYENKIIKIKANNVQKKCLKIKGVTYNFDDIAYTDVTEATKTGTGYEHTTDTDKYYKDGVEIEVNTVLALPTPDSSTVDKYYKEIKYVLHNGIKESDDVMVFRPYSNMTYTEGNGFVCTGRYGAVHWQQTLEEMKAQGFTHLVVEGVWSVGGDYNCQLRGVSTYNPSSIISTSFDTPAVTSAGTKRVFDLTGITGTGYFLLMLNGAGQKFTDIYFVKGENTLSLGTSTPPLYAWVNAGQGNTREVIIPTTGWTTVSDGTTNYYTIEINVEGMTSGFVGSSATDYVRPVPFNVAENDARKELFQLITDLESMEGKIKVTASEIPSQPFEIYLYGV